MTQLTENLAGTTYTTAYAYDADYRPTTATWQGSYQLDTAYHATLDRVSSITRKVSGVTRLTTTLGYAPGAAGISTASKRIASLTNTGRSAISYAYDVNGNISVITQAADRIEYYYDGLSQLKRENYSVGSTSYTRVYTYDTGGNIQSIQNHPYTMGNGTLGSPLSTDAYAYDTTWRDKLTAYNGQSISYDAIGNPTSYLGATLTWTMGRQLESYAKAGTSVQYTYNESGLRTSKVVNGTATTYHLVGDQVTMEQTGAQTPIRYVYDASGQLFLIQYDGQNYFYARNAQGDIIGMVDTNGNWVVEYKYDAWGKLLSTTGTLANTLGMANPYRYRGYRYDSETGLYYLQSRYYDPMIGRFLNADGYVATGQGLLGCNMFAYCGNNPANIVDGNGQLPHVNTMVADSGKLSTVLRNIIEFHEYAMTNSIATYYSMDSAAEAWAASNRLLSKDIERVAYIYQYYNIYYLSKTYVGMKGFWFISANVAIQTIFLHTTRSWHYGDAVAQIHTHPDPGSGYHNDFPSTNRGIYGGDRIVYENFGLKEVYIIPYNLCVGTMPIIKYSDPSTWCSR